MDEVQRKAQIQQTFNIVAEGYGTTGMEFFHNAAARLPDIFTLQGDEHLLDVATGTGIAVAALALRYPLAKLPVSIYLKACWPRQPSERRI